MSASKNLKHPLSGKELNVIFGAKDSDDELTLRYQLYDHPLIDRWLALWKMSDFNSGVVGATNFAGQIIDDEDFIVSTLNALILKINRHLLSVNRTELILDVVIERGVSQKVLNDLHLYFETYSLDEQLRDPLKNTFRLLNLFIHRMENFSDGKKNNCLVIEVSPARTIYLKLEEQDYQLFNKEWVWGELLLNYATLGVPTFAAFLNNSIPTPQRRFSAGVQISFVEHSDFNQQDQLNDWLEKNNLPINDSTNSIGFIPLGILIDPITASDEWQKINFLKQFKKFNKIKKIQLIGEYQLPDISTKTFAMSSNENGIQL